MKMKKKVLMSLAAALLLMVVMPMTVMASSAITSFSMDRTTVNSGQSVTFNVRTTSQVQFVFAMVDGVRTQGSRTGGSNEWVVTVSPTRSSTVSVFANATNMEANAAVISVPITVNAATPTPTPTPVPAVPIPTPPANLGPVSIASVTETPATAAGYVQLTIVTGTEANEVWVNFNRVNNTRGTGNFARATMSTQDTNSRTWVVNFRPTTWAVQQVEIGSNRTYNWPGAATQLYNLTLAHPFVPPVNPRINNVTVSNRTVATGSNTTFTITTNLDVENVWVRDVDGRETNANRTGNTTTQRTWTVTFPPGRTGNVTVFANATRNADNAATRTENITVQHTTAQIIGTPTASWTHWNQNETLINVTTNAYAQTVWAVMPGTGNRIQLNRSNTGTGNRTWSIVAPDTVNTGNIVIGISSQTGNVNQLTAEDSRTISRTGTGGQGIISTSLWNQGQTTVGRNEIISFSVRTNINVDDLRIMGSHATLWTQPARVSTHAGESEWMIQVLVHESAQQHTQLIVNVEAFSGGSRIDTRQLPIVTIQ